MERIITNRTILRIICAIIFLQSGIHIHGQTYHLSVTTAPFEHLEGGTSAINGVWDDPDLVLPIGFGFPFFDTVLTHLYLRSSFSFITLSNTPASATLSGIVVFGGDIVDRGFQEGTSLSPITYQTTGSTGNRVFTAEWENAGFYWDLFNNGSSTDFVNFQLRLFEADGTIEFHYGPNQHSFPEIDYNGNMGPSVQLIEAYNINSQMSLGEVLLLSGDPVDPDITTTLQDIFLDSPIPEDLVYRFTREPTGVLDPVVKFNYYHPNPTTGKLTLSDDYHQEKVLEVNVTDANGRHCLSDDQPKEIELFDLSPGTYDLLITTTGGKYRQRISLVK
jgi:hypothetical protein